MTDHAHELRRHARKIAHPAGDVPAVMLAAAAEIERLHGVIAGQHTMSRDDIIKLAQETGLALYVNDVTEEPYALTLERFAALVAAAEREECAKLADNAKKYNRHISKEISAAIRARSET